MERNFDNREFEQYLKKNADQYKMHPSEKVWEEIHSTLHPRRKWMGIAALLLLITGAIVTTVMLIGPASTENITLSREQLSEGSKVKENTLPASQKNFAPKNLLKDINKVKPISANKIPSIIPDNSIYNEPESTVIISNNEPVLSSVAAINTNKPGNDADFSTVAKPEAISKSYVPVPVIADKSFVRTEDDNTIQKTSAAVKTNKQNTVSILSTTRSKPVTGLAKLNVKKRLSFQIYFTPGVSYRRLAENKEAILAASGGPSIPTNVALEDVKNVVTHKPDLGFELGLAAKYPLSKRISLKTGLQFNVNKYDIRAFSYSGEPATIAIQGSNQQTVTRTSYYRNSSGYRPNWLSNVYFSLSIPVGAEIKILNGKKADLGFGITGQPTYLLDNRAYMISTDYKNYVRIPDLIRRWNVNAGAEIIVGIKGKRTNWQIGPQVRYQALSSFKDKYPVKENLFNFGLKAGILLNQ